MGLDRERILARVDDLDRYLGELRQVAPEGFEEYRHSVEKRRACERLLQIAVESVLDICSLLVTGLRLGLPSEEDDLFEKLEEAGVVSRSVGQRLRTMRGFRNLLVHEYSKVDDRTVFSILRERLGDFDGFKSEVLGAVRRFAP